MQSTMMEKQENIFIFSAFVKQIFFLVKSEIIVNGL